jgi:1,4-dihydroxy-2-naphthoate octaprenyltransferase
MSSWKAWLLAFRPKTLTAALVPIMAGTAWVFSRSAGEPLTWWVPALALFASVFIQIGTNLVNDAVDFKKGADTDERIGPVRVTQQKIFTLRQVLWMGSAFFLLAALCGLPLVLKGGTTILLIGLASILLGYGYTAGPFPLAYLGLGDPFVILFFGLIAVGGLVYLMTGVWFRDAWVLGLQTGLHATVLIAINNLRDMNGDAKVGKKTLPVRFGLSFGRYEIAVLAIAPFLLNLYWLRQGWWPVVLPLLSLPLALKIVKLIFETEPSPAYNRFLAKGAGLHLAFGALLSLGFILC